MPKVRPEINEDCILKVKVAYPEETAMLGNAETVEWAINKALKSKPLFEVSKMVQDGFLTLMGYLEAGDFDKATTYLFQLKGQLQGMKKVFENCGLTSPPVVEK